MDRVMRGLIAVLLLVTVIDSHAQTSRTTVQLFSADPAAQSRCRNGTLRAVPRCSGIACGDPTPLTAEWSLGAGSAEAQLGRVRESGFRPSGVRLEQTDGVIAR